MTAAELTLWADAHAQEITRSTFASDNLYSDYRKFSNGDTYEFTDVDADGRRAITTKINGTTVESYIL